MRSALQAGDIASAANYFSTTTRESYRQQFQVLKDAGVLNQVVASMGDFRITRIIGNFAQGDMLVAEDGVTYSYFILFVKDDDGIWRIKSF